MKRIVTLSTLLLFFAIGFTACEKYAKDTPHAIKKQIRETNKMSRCLGRVVEYEYNNEKIYCFLPHPDCFDAASIYYDEKGKELWGYSGWGGCWGTPLENFREKAIFKKIIWTHKTWYELKNE